MGVKSPLHQRRAVFLDRDGTVNEEVDYLHRAEDFVFIPGAPQAIRELRDAGFLVIIVTNQSGVARGYFSLEAVERLHVYVQEELAKFGTAVDAFYVCPHHPQEGTGDLRIACACRKGSPGMLLQAAAEHQINLGSSWMVGDKAADIQAGERAGCAPILVLTGYGADESARVAPTVPRYPDLAAAAEYILHRAGKEK